MQFHQYIAHRQRALSEFGQEPQAYAATLQSIRETDSYTFAVTQAHATEEMIRQATAPAERDHLRMQLILLIAEQQWYRDERPFYNVWPVVHDVVNLLDIDIPWDRLQLPFHTLMLNFAKGNEPFGLATMMMCISRGGESGESKEQIVTFEGYHLQAQEHRVFGRLISDNSNSITETVLRRDPSKTTQEGDDVLAFALRLACFLSLIAEGNDIITPVLLQKDEARAEELPAELLQEWLKRKAEKAKQQHVFGFDVGKALQAKKDRSPTFVMPYWAVRWTGKGGAIPRYVEVSSHLKNVNPLMDVPTGYLGHETAEELRKVFVAYENTETVYFLRDGERPTKRK
ncbi:MAG: hypothetical protein NTY87_10410 [Planctomycetia bacterium]|nr:hypothetical protein [Planctomycetia bacterium]